MSFKKVTAINELKGLMNRLPDYSFAQLLFTVCREATFKQGTGKLSDLLYISDEEMLTSIENCAAREEKETEIYN